MVTDNPLIAPPIAAALRANGAFEVLGYLSPLKASAARISEAGADVVVVDECEDREPTLRLIREISDGEASVCIVALVLRMDGDWLKPALEAGANGAICKAIQPTALATLLRETVGGHIVHSPHMLSMHEEVREAPFSEDSPLTAREREILRLVASGATNGEIAGVLWITQQTVKFHLSNIYRKLDVANRTEACHYAHVTGLAAAPAELPATASGS